MSEHSESEFDKLTSQIEHLTAALRTSRRIGIAIGLLIARNGVTADEGFALLGEESQRSQRRLREVAEDIIQTGLALGDTAPHPADPSR